MTRFRNALQAQLAEAGIDVTSFERIDVVEEEDDEFDDDLQTNDDSLDDDDEFGDEFGDESSGDEDDDSEDAEEEEAVDAERHKREFYHLLVPADSAVEVWEKIRGLTEYTGYWPVLTEDYGELFEFMSFNDTDTREIVDRSVRLNIANWLKSKASEQNLTAELSEGATFEENGKNGSQDAEYHTVQSLNGGNVSLVLVPTKVSWHVPAVLKWGGANDGIKPEYHTAMLKKWQDEYGAELVCSTPSVLEMRVDYPPKTAADAMKLAREQFIYCPDIVHQGTTSVVELAKGLVNSKRWFFWWD